MLRLVSFRSASAVAMRAPTTVSTARLAVASVRAYAGGAPSQEEITERVLEVVKNTPKVDPGKVCARRKSCYTNVRETESP